ncbi:hypothetical protein DNTS_005474 [Danionella cerebrum]|uniref:Alpha-ketoglutarate-dependent dioxygenase FTO n=1 Tax=Danionella cerebrum TaxID=2873325 RepID=A0A553MUE8_9TELE|nr:hypothetical protein DNTS_005474 [Danionella translucida]
MTRRRLLQELGEQRIPYLSPADPGFQDLWNSSYAGLTLRLAGNLPNGLHEKVQSALVTLQRCGCLLRDLVRVRDRDVFTTVSRILVGQPGYTYRYLDTRLFTIPWHCDGEGQKDEKPCCDAHLMNACKALWELNEFFCSDVKEQTNTRGVKRTHSDSVNSEDMAGDGMCEESAKDRLAEEKDQDDEDSGQGCSHSSPLPVANPGLVQFNVTLINYMDPTAMTQLKEEPYYGMGKMAVGWHHDENLVPLSPVAVYSYSCPAEPKNEGMAEKEKQSKGKELQKVGEGTSKEVKEAGEASGKEEMEKERSCWRVGLKVAWDIHTPGLALPLQSGDCYYLTDDLNRTHQHCVLAGDTARFSSTHRVVQCCTGTLDYIQKRCSEALENLHRDPGKNIKSLVSLLPSTLQHTEDIHNETTICESEPRLSDLMPGKDDPAQASLKAHSSKPTQVEFEWLRQYWFQGRRYTRFCSWWSKPMEQMENDWKEMERMAHEVLRLTFAECQATPQPGLCTIHFSAEEDTQRNKLEHDNLLNLFRVFALKANEFFLIADRRDKRLKKEEYDLEL